jgi:hypothetical protein
MGVATTLLWRLGSLICTSVGARGMALWPLSMLALLKNHKSLQFGFGLDRCFIQPQGDWRSAGAAAYIE